MPTDWHTMYDEDGNLTGFIPDDGGVSWQSLWRSEGQS